MGNQQRHAALGVFAKVLEHRRLGAGVQRSRRLVKNQQIRLLAHVRA